MLEVKLFAALLSSRARSVLKFALMRHTDFVLGHVDMGSSATSWPLRLTLEQSRFQMNVVFTSYR